MDKNYNFPSVPNVEKPTPNISIADLAKNALQNEATKQAKAALFNGINKTPTAPSNTPTDKRLQGNEDSLIVGNDTAIFDIDSPVVISFLPTDYFNKAGEIQTTPQIDFKVGTVDITKNIRSVETGLLNQEGFISEVTGIDGYNITIQLVLIESLTSKPDSLFKSVESILKIAAPLNVKSSILENVGVNQIMIKNYSIPLMSDRKNYYAISVNAISVSPDLFILEDF